MKYFASVIVLSLFTTLQAQTVIKFGENWVYFSEFCAMKRRKNVKNFGRSMIVRSVKFVTSR